MQLSIQDRIQLIKTNKSSSTTFLKFNNTQQQWTSQPQFQLEPNHQQKIITVSHNVLIDYFKSHLLYSQQRYLSILKDLQQLSPDIISLNEVTSTMDKLVMESQWIKKDYWIGGMPKHTRKGFGNLLITKIKPLCYQSIKVSRLPRSICTGFFHLRKNHKDIIITVSSAHLISMTENHEKRVHQLRDLLQQLSKFEKYVDGNLIQGDMNFHSEEENAILPKLQLKDAWLSKYSIQQNPGYTFDTKYNQLINEQFWGFEDRRMRLDRMFMRGNFCEVQDMQVILDQPIYGQKKQVKRNNVLKGGLSYIADRVFKANLFRNKEQYLFKSDHFGLKAILKIK